MHTVVHWRVSTPPSTPASRKVGHYRYWRRYGTVSESERLPFARHATANVKGHTNMAETKERKMSPKGFLHKCSTKAANSAIAFLAAHRAFLQTGDLAV